MYTNEAQSNEFSHHLCLMGLSSRQRRKFGDKVFSFLADNLGRKQKSYNNKNRKQRIT